MYLCGRWAQVTAALFLAVLFQPAVALGALTRRGISSRNSSNNNNNRSRSSSLAVSSPPRTSRRRWVGDLVASTIAFGGIILISPTAAVPDVAVTDATILAADSTGGNDSPSPSTWRTKLESLMLEKDEVVRVLDSNTVKLKRGGLVTFAAVSTPSGYNQSNFATPVCMVKSPSGKLRALLPRGSKVGIYIVDKDNNGNNNGRPREALIVAEKENVLINAELVRTGFARPVAKGREGAAKALGTDFIDHLRLMQQQAEDAGTGFYIRCENTKDPFVPSDDQFEPLDYTTETKWGDDGGKQILVKREDATTKKTPINPRDTKGCSDFQYYEDSLIWYERYFPYYGDVARLDRDGDGVPCPGLPHTKDQTRYRMKVPITQK